MARKFLYLVAILIVLVIAALFALALWSTELSRLAFVPRAAFTEQPTLAANTYRDKVMWLATPTMGANDPARWQPTGAQKPAATRDAPSAVFFIHPTSYLRTAAWNAPVDDAESQERARLFIRAMASPFSRGGQIWAPRYRQAAFGAFLTEEAAGQKALDAAYGDVAQAFDQFLAEAPQDAPIILAGHSQGARHLIRLLHDRVAGTPLVGRIAAVYAIGWPISLEHDLPHLGLPACTSAQQKGCILSWLSFAEPADPAMLLDLWRKAPGLDGKPHGNSAILCTNPLTGQQGGSAPASANLGTLKPDAELKQGELVAGGVPARCDAQGLLLIGDPPDMGAYVLPGNNYHVYDIPLFWANVQADAERRAAAWKAAQ
ncbi:DUF3089 domain-containing protein [Caenibius sp. WL]|uniref:DUF3089 domain-containing protein n=1 Tax=Caenibius sp. WL TaxID=2872646 RepID=UPI001C99FDC0|nr:DUF3089 domain-containing protein [Caenibius sp. WL]QZP07427.1 DUF3089 domain-containing protein [Caenibius sp. WL]